MTVNTQIASQTPEDAFAKSSYCCTDTARVWDSEDSFGDLQTFLLHSGQRGAGHVFGPAYSRETSLLQDKVIVGRGVHGVKDIGVVGNLQLLFLTDFLNQFIILGSLAVQVVFDHGFPHDCGSLILTGDLRQKHTYMHPAVYSELEFDRVHKLLHHWISW